MVYFYGAQEQLPHLIPRTAFIARRSAGILYLVLLRMRKFVALAVSAALLVPLLARADSLYVFFRHGEKPDNDSGQLTCKGLNRALNLPRVLISRFGAPDTLYSSAPYQDKTGSSLRPLMTMVPVAIQLSKPVILKYHAVQTGKLTNALLKENASPVTYIAWEYKNLVAATRRLVSKTGGDPSQIPFWSSDDFDSLYVIRLDDRHHFKSFIHETEGLNGVSDRCPPQMTGQHMLSPY